MRAENDLQELLDAVSKDAGSKVERKTDNLGFEWLVIHDGDFEDLVTTVHVIASEFDAKGFGPQLLAALFPFEGNFKEKRVFWIYGFKPGAFWPFIPTGEGQQRDNAEELRAQGQDGEGASRRGRPHTLVRAIRRAGVKRQPKRRTGPFRHGRGQTPDMAVPETAGVSPLVR